MASFLFQKKSDWFLYKIMLEIILQLKPFSFIQWFLLSVISMTLSTYFNVLFFSTITINVNLGLRYLLLFFLFENIDSLCSRRESIAKDAFVLDFLKEFQTRLNQRILSADWLKIKLSDQVDLQRKIDDAVDAAGHLVRQFLSQLKVISNFCITITTIFSICPIATIFIGLFYFLVDQYYFNAKNAQLNDMQEKIIEQHSKSYSKYARVNNNLFDYVIHHEKDQVIKMKNEIKIDLRRNWHSLDYLYDYQSFEKDLLGKFCTLITLLIHCTFNEMNTSTSIIPLYHYLSRFTDSIHSTLEYYTQWIKTKKDYDLIQPILEEYEQRTVAEQIDLKDQFHIEDLSFDYQGTRQGFHLQHRGSLTFKMGETILVTGKSGAGKSTFYDILTGIIPTNAYSAKIRIDDQESATTNLHSIEKCRTIVLQDSHTDYRSSIFSMITNIDEDDVKQQKTPEMESLVWQFLRLVQIDDFVRDELKSDLYQPIENKLSGGQKIRLLLARALYRADQRHSSLVILDEPDQGLPAETTVAIIENIMKWYRTKGILFLTLHTERAQMLSFDQVLHIDQGVITKIK